MGIRCIPIMTFIFMLVVALVAPAAAQDAPAETDTSRIDALIEALEAEKSRPEPSVAVAPQAVSPAILGEDGVRSMKAAFKAYYDYRVHGFDHRKNVFAWQLLSSKIIFALVLTLVFLGVYFSWLQFHAGLKPGVKDDSPTTVELGTSGIKVSSPILGVIILTLSLAFFYLYLVNVYPIEEIF